MTTWLICIVGAYLAGSIPFGLLIGKLKGVDVRQHGSKNIGATNVTRVLGRPLGLLCFGLDVLKGAIPVLAAGFATGVIRSARPDIEPAEMWWWLGVAAAAIAGHIASVFLRFKGGKGVATGFGVMLAMWPLLTFPALGAVATWYAVLRLTGYVSVSSMSAAVSVPLWYIASSIPGPGPDITASIKHGAPVLIMTCLLAVFVVYRHRANLARLRRGEEPKTRRSRP